MTNAELEALHKQCSDNRALLTESGRCACFFCLRRFNTSEITEWVGKRDRALCPRCGIDSVLPDPPSAPVSDDTLVAMERHWFGLRDGRKAR